MPCAEGIGVKGYRRIWNPAAFQGEGFTRRYFEGWYFKQVDAPGQNIVAVIPGLSFSEDGGAKHAFVQFVRAGSPARYFVYPVDAFWSDPGASFRIRIGPNEFSPHGVTLHLADDTGEVRGQLEFGPWTPWPMTRLSPGVMGWYRFVPRMETYHGVLSMDHRVTGHLTADGMAIDFGEGRGYVEKDWGRSFPSSWIWAQSNHFRRVGTSVMVSVAKVPWLREAFVGNIAGLLLDGTLHRFATYTGARLTCIETAPNEAHLTLADKREELDLALHGRETLNLKAPVLGAMEGRDAESLGGAIDVTLRRLRGGRATIAFRDTGLHSGIEVMNAKDELGSRPCASSDAEQDVEAPPPD